MAYERSFWVDHVTDQHGEVIQYGTLLDQLHFNNMEVGISDLGLAVALMQFKQSQDDFQYERAGIQRWPPWEHPRERPGFERLQAGA